MKYTCCDIIGWFAAVALKLIKAVTEVVFSSSDQSTEA